MGPNAGTTGIAPVPSGTGLSNFDITLVNGSYKIKKAPSTTTVSCPTSVIYNGSAQTPCSAKATGVGMSDVTLAPSHTDNVNVRTAHVSATFAGDANHIESSASTTFTITYNTCLLYDPNKAVKSGATIPLKIQLCSATKANLSSSAVVVKADQLTLGSTVTSGLVVIDAGIANPDGNFRFDPSLGPGYIFNLKTTGLRPDPYKVRIGVTSDPQPHFLSFQVQ